jgi:hypothetical protein
MPEPSASSSSVGNPDFALRNAHDPGSRDESN